MPWLRILRTRSICFAFVVAMGFYFAKEWYPFSHFPMYSRLRPWVTLVYVADQNDQPLAFRRVFNFAASNAKKQFNSRLLAKGKGKYPNAIETSKEHRQQAAAEMLDYFSERRNKAKLKQLGVTELRFYNRILRWENSEMTETDEFLAAKKL